MTLEDNKTKERKSILFRNIIAEIQHIVRMQVMFMNS